MKRTGGVGVSGLMSIGVLGIYGRRGYAASRALIGSKLTRGVSQETERHRLLYDAPEKSTLR